MDFFWFQTLPLKLKKRMPTFELFFEQEAAEVTEFVGRRGLCFLCFLLLVLYVQNSDVTRSKQRKASYTVQSLLQCKQNQIVKSPLLRRTIAC